METIEQIEAASSQQIFTALEKLRQQVSELTVERDGLQTDCDALAVALDDARKQNKLPPKVAVIDTMKTKDNVLAIFSSEFQVAPVKPESGQAVVFVESHDDVKALPPADIINGYKWDGAKNKFVKKGILG